MGLRDLIQYSEADKIEILKDYNRTIITMQYDVDAIKTWMEKQPHLPEIPSDEKIQRFLIMNKFHIEKTKSKLDWYYTLRNKLPEFFQLDPTGEETKRLMDSVYFFPMPKLTPDLCRVICMKKNETVDEFDPLIYFIHTYNLSELRIIADYSRTEIQILDLSGFRLSHFSKITPMLLKRATVILEKAYANRVSAFIIINVPPVLDTFVTLLKKCLPEKLMQRVHTFRDTKGLSKLVPKEYLPKDFGGEQKSLDELNELWKAVFEENKAIFERLRSFQVDETLRPGKPVDDEDIFGPCGNFRKIDVD